MRILRKDFPQEKEAYRARQNSQVCDVTGSRINKLLKLKIVKLWVENANILATKFQVILNQTEYSGTVSVWSTDAWNPESAQIQMDTSSAFRQKKVSEIWMKSRLVR